MVLAVAVLGGCGSSDDEPKSFDEDGFGITFEYPGDLQRTEDVNLSQSAGNAQKTVALATSEDNAIFVQRYGLNRSVGAGDAGMVRKELDQVLGRLSGSPVEGRRIDVGGPLTFRYEIDRLDTPKDGRSTIVVTFDGDTEYFINCQSVPDGRDELEKACDQAIDTLRLKGDADLAERTPVLGDVHPEALVEEGRGGQRPPLALVEAACPALGAGSEQPEARKAARPGLLDHRGVKGRGQTAPPEGLPYEQLPEVGEARIGLGPAGVHGRRHQRHVTGHGAVRLRDLAPHGGVAQALAYSLVLGGWRLPVIRCEGPVALEGELERADDRVGVAGRGGPEGKPGSLHRGPTLLRRALAALPRRSGLSGAESPRTAA